jgi:uncharacterized protein YkuJ
MNTTKVNNETMKVIVTNNSDDMTKQSAAVATQNATENGNAVASVKQTKTMGTFNFNITQDSAVRKYDNEGAYQTLQAMMNSKEQLTVKFYSGKDGIPCAWVESRRVAGFKYQLKSETFQGLMNYLTKGEVTDFDSNPAATDTVDEGADFQLMVLQELVNEGKTIQYVPLFRENPEYVNAVLPCFKGKVIFRIKRTNDMLDYLRENKQIA